MTSKLLKITALNILRDYIIVIYLNISIKFLLHASSANFAVRDFRSLRSEGEGYLGKQSLQININVTLHVIAYNFDSRLLKAKYIDTIYSNLPRLRGLFRKSFVRITLSNGSDACIHCPVYNSDGIGNPF